MSQYEDAIRKRAYFIWEGEGRPHGKHLEHWLRAESEIARHGKIQMGALPALLHRLADALAANRSGFSAFALHDVSAALSLLQAVGRDTDEAVVAAALTILLLPHDQAQRIVADLGMQIELVPNLIPNRPIAVDGQLIFAIANESRQSALVAAALFFASYNRAARGGDTARLNALRGWIDSLPLEGRNSDVCATLRTKVANVVVRPAAELKHGHSVFSISIDLVGSTDAKTRVMKLADGNDARIDKFNTQIYKEFCRIERYFYQAATSKSGLADPLELNKFFAVKGIGDEIWILFELSPEKIKKQGARLIDAALQVAGKLVHFLATENEEPSPFDRHFDYGVTEPVIAPIKIFIDLVQHASNLGKMRDDELIAAIPQMLKESSGSEASNSEITEISQRLCFGTSEATPWARSQLYRTDYIGHEIDRFFRATKAALPGAVCVGESMVQRLGLTPTIPTDGTAAAVLDSSGEFLRGGELRDPIHCVRKTLPEREMKGIGRAYETYVFFAPRDLNRSYNSADTSRAKFSATQELLTAELVQRTANLYYPNKPVEDSPSA